MAGSIPSAPDWNGRINPVLLALAALALLTGLLAYLAGSSNLAHWLWIGGIVPSLATLVVAIPRSLMRGVFGLDIIAALSMAGTLALGENLAGVVISLMFSGGQVLEDFAQGRARRDMSALLGRAPSTANRYGPNGLEQVAIAKIMPGDRLMVRTGETVPTDGVITMGNALLDESALTGEAMPVMHETGHTIMSGVTNAASPFDMSAATEATESTYAGIIRLVEAAQAAKAPASRLADRYGLWFLALTVLITGATWFLTGDAVRALAVLVIATPCPLILAVPVAITAGMSRCARVGVLVKGGGALEGLASVTILLCDKTGTLTDGRAKLVAIEVYADRSPDAVLKFAASLEQASQHVLAQAVVAAARKRGLALDNPTHVREEPGSGLEGAVSGHSVALGGLDYVVERTGDASGAARLVQQRNNDGSASIHVAIDGQTAGALILADQIRIEAPQALRRIRAAGISRIVMVTGDRADVANRVSDELGLDACFSELTPAGKVAIVEAESTQGGTVMIGDGVNDAPALAAATIGVAMGARGAAASSQAADIVLLVDRLDRLADAITVARRTRTIAVQSVGAGISLSLAGMMAAAFGLLTPLNGAILQEIIDVAVVLNALRALGRHDGNSAVGSFS